MSKYYFLKYGCSASKEIKATHTLVNTNNNKIN